MQEKNQSERFTRLNRLLTTAAERVAIGQAFFGFIKGMDRLPGGIITPVSVDYILFLKLQTMLL